MQHFQNDKSTQIRIGVFLVAMILLIGMGVHRYILSPRLESNPDVAAPPVMPPQVSGSAEVLLSKAPAPPVKMSKEAEKKAMGKRYAQESLLRQPWGRNPFLKPGSRAIKDFPQNQEEGTPAKQLEVQGVMIYGKKRVALVNGRKVREGEVVDGFRIVSIAEDGIRARALNSSNGSVSEIGIRL